MTQMIKKTGGTDSDHDDHHGRDHIDHHDLVMMTIILIMIMTIVRMTKPDGGVDAGLVAVGSVQPVNTALQT